MNEIEGWIGVDLDGTLAIYEGWKGYGHIGDPVPGMLARVRSWVGEGKKVKIFTARCAHPDGLETVKRWLSALGLGGLEVTNIKDMGMRVLYDDRCIRVERNTGRVAEGAEHGD